VNPRTNPDPAAYNKGLDTLLSVDTVTPAGNKTNWKKRLHTAYKVVRAQVVSDDTMVFFSFPSQAKHLSGQNSVAENVVRVINAALASAAKTIAVSSMTLFDQEGDWIFMKLLELPKTRPELVLQLLVDSQDGSWQRLQSLFAEKLGPENVAVFTEAAATTRVPSSYDTAHRCRVEIYGVGCHEPGAHEWLFHTKVIVIDRTFAIFTTANYRAAGYGGLSAVNKYCLTRNPAWIDQTIRYLNAYFWWARARRDGEQPEREDGEGGNGGETG
jgi:phosphatidylserine/phosphatidylglycerophosphate/cardiolipin synthase-like enzyme